MPFIRFKGFDKHFLKSFSPTLIGEFSALAEIPEEKVKIELLPVESIINSPLSVEIMMFSRSQGVHDQIAQMIHRQLKEHAYDNVHIFFILLSPSLYYKEGKPLDMLYNSSNT